MWYFLVVLCPEMLPCARELWRRARCPPPRPVPEGTVGTYSIPPRPGRHQLRRIKKAVPTADERLGAAHGPLLPLRLQGRRKYGLGVASCWSHRVPRCRTTCRAWIHSPVRCSVPGPRGPMLLKMAQTLTPAPCTPTFTSLQRASSEVRSVVRRVAWPSGSSWRPSEASVQMHENAVTDTLTRATRQSNGLHQSHRYLALYHCGLRPRRAVWGPPKTRIRGLAVSAGLGPMWHAGVCK